MKTLPEIPEKGQDGHAQIQGLCGNVLLTIDFFETLSGK